MSDDFWEAIHRTKEWGVYPDIDVVRILMRQFPDKKKRSTIKILDLGCGTGANSIMMAKEGFDVHGIDFSPTAIFKLGRNLSVSGVSFQEDRFRVGDFSALPWDPCIFDVVVDCMALYANAPLTIKAAVKEVERVMKRGGLFISRSWGVETKELSGGCIVDHNTIDAAICGPCKGFGISHFFDQNDIEKLFVNFEIDTFVKVTRDDIKNSLSFSEWVFAGFYSGE